MMGYGISSVGNVRCSSKADKRWRGWIIR